MGLSARLFTVAAARPHVLVVTAPGATAIRLAVERQLAARGWPSATGPADTDVLLVCGDPEDRLRRAVDTVWGGTPGPRARARARTVREVPGVLDAAVVRLTDAGAQRSAAAGAPDPQQPPPGDADSGGDDTDTDSGDETDSGGDMGMDMGMEMPAGLMMADRAEDRDGLKLDQLHVQLGPVLPEWPAGLVLRVSVQGDVVQDAVVQTWGAPTPAVPFWDEPALTSSRGEQRSPEWAGGRTAAAHLDSAGRLLALAGWEDAAARARRWRDRLLTSPSDPAVRRGVARLRRTVCGSRTLRWSLRGLGILDHDEAVAAGVGGPALRAGGDAHDRLCRWLIEASVALGGATGGADHDAGRSGLPADEGPRGRMGGQDSPSRALLDVLPRLVTGLDLAAARLVVASLDPDPDELVREPVPAHG